MNKKRGMSNEKMIYSLIFALFISVLGIIFFSKLRALFIVLLFVCLCGLGVVVFILRKDKQSAATRQKNKPEMMCENINNSTNDSTAAIDRHYEIKSNYISQNEKGYFDAVKEIVGDKYLVQPQVNLASIIDKVSAEKYRNELFRNIDIGIFDNDYHIKVLIEINDATHREPSRRKRDEKVQEICNDANIPIIKLWTTYGINKEYIKKRLKDYLELD